MEIYGNANESVELGGVMMSHSKELIVSKLPPFTIISPLQKTSNVDIFIQDRTSSERNATSASFVRTQQDQDTITEQNSKQFILNAKKIETVHSQPASNNDYWPQRFN